jgi:predicted amidohydrolase
MVVVQAQTSAEIDITDDFIVCIGMEQIILASAQTLPKTDVATNIDDHIRLVQQASRHQVDLIVFPELSLTGYDREQAKEKAFTIDDSRIKTLSEASDNYKMTIVAGAPIMIESDLYIASYIIQPNTAPLIYIKQYLHNGEVDYYQSRKDYNPTIIIRGEIISFAICADIDNPKHVEAAASIGCTTYVSSIFFTTGSIANAHEMLSNYARKHRLNILMSNYGGSCWKLESGGRSAMWTNKGNLIQESNNRDECLVIAQRTDNEWNGRIIRTTI